MSFLLEIGKIIERTMCIVLALSVCTFLFLVELSCWFVVTVVRGFADKQINKFC